MRYVLDFDRVLFDTDAFIKELKDKGIYEIPRGPDLLRAVVEKEIDWTAFVHPGVIDFLKTHGEECTIVSSYFSRKRLDNEPSAQDLELFQSEKIRLSGLSGLVKKVIITGESKEAALKGLYQVNEHMILLDDEREHIEVGKKLGYQTVWFQTPTHRVDLEGAFERLDELHRVDSFTAFVELTQQWNLKQ